MKNKLFFILLCYVILLLAGCKSADGTKVEDYEQIAFDALVERVTANPNGDEPVPNSYLYQWSDNPATDILHMNTMLNKDEQLTCEQYYATDGINVWRGIIIISTIDCEILDIYSYHIFTSGVTPIMSLAASFGVEGDIVDFHDYYERGIFKKDYGTFEITQIVDSIYFADQVNIN